MLFAAEFLHVVGANSISKTFSPKTGKLLIAWKLMEDAFWPRDN